MSNGKKSDLGLIIKLLSGIVAGIVLGMIAHNMTLGGSSTGIAMMQVIGSIKHILGQLIFFTIPLIIIGFIAPSITRLGQNASKMLTYAVVISYLSSIGAATFALIIGYIVIPMLKMPGAIADATPLPTLLFELNIPMIMPVMSALVLALMLGVASLVTRAETIIKILNEVESIVMLLVNKIVVPLLPFFVAGTFSQLAYEGAITTQLPVFLKIIIIAIAGHIAWLSILYAIGGLVSKRNPFEVVKHYGPAYLTAVGTMSSAATLPVALRCAGKSKALSRNTVDFVIPICATIHLAGSVLTETLFVTTIIYLTTGALPPVGTMIVFIILLGVFAVGAPGVPGGTVMASLGIVIAVLGFNDNMVGLLLAIFALQDSFGTACNVTGDGAIALMMDGIFNPKGENLQTGE